MLLTSRDNLSLSAFKACISICKTTQQFQHWSHYTSWNFGFSFCSFSPFWNNLYFFYITLWSVAFLLSFTQKIHTNLISLSFTQQLCQKHLKSIITSRCYIHRKTYNIKVKQRSSSLALLQIHAMCCSVRKSVCDINTNIINTILISTIRDDLQQLLKDMIRLRT